MGKRKMKKERQMRDKYHFLIFLCKSDCADRLKRRADDRIWFLLDFGGFAVLFEYVLEKHENLQWSTEETNYPIQRKLQT